MNSNCFVCNFVKSIIVILLICTVTGCDKASDSVESDAISGGFYEMSIVESVNNKTEPETTQIMVDRYDMKLYNALPITMTAMNRESTTSTNNNVIKYKYTDDVYDVEILHYYEKNIRKRLLIINEHIIEIVTMNELGYDGTYFLSIADVNGDGQKDVVLKNISYNQLAICVFLYDGKEYREIDEPDIDIEVKAKLLNENKIKVSHNGSDDIFMMRDLYVRFLEERGVYQEERIIQPWYEINSELVRVDYELYQKSGEVIIAVDMHYTDMGQSTGIVLVAYYRVVDSEYKLIETRLINSSISYK